MPKRFSKHAPVFLKSNSIANSKTSANVSSAVFIHSLLDDYGLPASAFRIYCHVARRAGKDGIAWSSVASMSEVCRLHPQTVRKALQLLVRHRFLRREQRKGRTTHYRLAPPSEWRPRFFIDEAAERNPSVSDSQPGATNQMEGHPCEKDVVKGNPSEVNPPKVNPQQTHRDVPIEVPRSVQEAVAVAVQLGIDESFAKQEFHNKKAVGWKDGYGNPIISWADHLQARWPYEQRKRAERHTARRTSGNRPCHPPRQFNSADYKQPVKEF
jgi:hypothetical protein